MKKLTIAVALLIAFGAGLGISGVVLNTASELAAPSAHAAPGPTKWEYQCMNFTKSYKKQTALANELGAQGWELATVAGFGATNLHACFKRPLP